MFSLVQIIIIYVLKYQSQSRNEVPRGHGYGAMPQNDSWERRGLKSAKKVSRSI
jgi:hypothetical protein